MAKPRVHLLANAHLDPVWLWEWPEGERGVWPWADVLLRETRG